MRTVRFIADRGDAGKMIKDILRGFGFSGTLIKRLKQSESGILKNGEPARTVDIIEPGDVITVNIPPCGAPPESSGAALKTLFEDEDLLCVDKPPGMPVHESRRHRGDAVSNAAASRLDGAFRAVYRLDRDTSGALLIAKNELAAAKLAGRVDKDYYGVCLGVPKKSGVIDAPIARLDGSIIKRCVSEGGERAITHYEVLRYGGGAAFVRFRLETGRTHQIRVHMAHLGFPLAGDTLYGDGRGGIARQALHCGEIRFEHPISGERIAITSPLPEDMALLLKEMM